MTKRAMRLKQELEKILRTAIKSARRERQQGMDPLLLDWYFDEWIIEGLVTYAATPNALKELVQLADLATETVGMYWDKRRMGKKSKWHFWNFCVIGEKHIVAEAPVVAMHRLVSLKEWDEDWTRRATETAKPFMWTNQAH